MNSPGAAPWQRQLAVAVGFGASAWWLTRPSALAALPAPASAKMSG